ncbi:MAG: LemA family protein, partial [Brevibacterium aurantiacum]|nr:LemA family protein [Brevibacterium aurantiacum]
MVWFIVGACVLALVILALTVTILRFNQLSMARSLCDEAKRQLLVELRGRHALVPAYIGTLPQITPQDLSFVELALAS